MLRTPATFVSLLSAQEHPDPLNFVFRGDELLVRQSDLALPDNATLNQLGWPEQRFQPVGLLDQRYCRAGWIDKGAVACDGHAFRRLRSLFGAMDEGLLAVAGRAYQIANWARDYKNVHQDVAALEAAGLLMREGRKLIAPWDEVQASVMLA